MNSYRIRRSFKIEVVASVVENRLLILDDDKDLIKEFENEIFDFCEFITGESVNFGNLWKFSSIINNLLLEQFPDMLRITPIGYMDLNMNEIKLLINTYKKKHGDIITIKSVKKQITKTLEIQDN